MSEDKRLFIEASFERWHKDISKAEKLLNAEEYFLEAIILLSCYVDAFARLRYPNENSDVKAFKRIIRNYSGNADVFNEIDLLFLYCWKNTTISNEAIYRKLENYEKLISVLVAHYGNEEEIAIPSKRYVNRIELCNLLISKNLSWFNESNFQEYVELFSNGQIFYKFVRCEAVHNVYCPLFNEVHSENGVRFDDNHHVGRDLILSTVKNIHSSLAAECKYKNLWPQEL